MTFPCPGNRDPDQKGIFHLRQRKAQHTAYPTPLYTFATLKLQTIAKKIAALLEATGARGEIQDVPEA